MRFEPLRPVFVKATVALIGRTFYAAYRPVADVCAPGSSCAPASRHRNRIIVWLTAVLGLLFVTFPYYVAYLPV